MFEKKPETSCPYALTPMHTRIMSRRYIGTIIWMKRVHTGEYAKNYFYAWFRSTCAIEFHETEIVKFVALRQSIGVYELRKPKRNTCVCVCVCVGRTRPFLCTAKCDWWKYFRENVFGYFPKYVNRIHKYGFVVAKSTRWIAQRTRSECINCDGLIHETFTSARRTHISNENQKKKEEEKTKLSNWIDLLTFVQNRSLFARTWFE